MRPTQKRFSFATSPRQPHPRGQQAPAIIVPRFPLRAVMAPGLRLAQRMPAGARGLAIGYGFPEDLPIPSWGVVLSASAPGRVDIPAARRLAGVSAEVPLLLVGNGPGVKTVFQTFIANHTEHVAGVAFFGADYPTDEYSLSLWVHLAERSHGRKGLRLLTDLRHPDGALASVLGSAQAPAEGPKDEAPGARIVRLLAETFGPTSPKMPDPQPPTEHFSPPVES